MDIYLDNSATTRPCDEAVAACVYAMETEYGNPSSLHRRGFAAERLIDTAAKQLAAALSCDPAELIFTSGATESNNLAIFGAAEASARRGRTIVTTAIEHPSVLEAVRQLEERGYTVRRLLPNGDGVYTAQQFADAVDGDTVLVSCMMVNNEMGLILPVPEIAKAVKRKNPGVLVHVDAVQGFLKLPIRLKNSAVDLLSVSGHKVRAPKGIGALYIRRGVRILPRTFGGGQQNGLRPGTESVPLISAFGAAVEVQRTRLTEELERYRQLRTRLEEAADGVEGLRVNFSGGHCAPHIVSLSAHGIRSEVMLHFLEQYDISVSSGSACAKGAHSYVLTALGLSDRTADETIRVSFGAETTPDMIDELVGRMAQGLATLAKQR